MSRKIVSLVLSIIFMLFIAAPTIIIIVDNSIDVSTFYTSGEEEEKGSEKNKDNDLLFLEFNINEDVFASKKVENNLGYYSKTYSKPHLNLISPPPELIIV